MFKLHSQLEKDSLLIKKLELSQLRIIKNSNNPWLLLIPEVDDIKEIHQLSHSQQQILMSEITKYSELMQLQFKADKMNVGALGNMVPQLHIHIICRYKDDAAWPGALWGAKQEFVENEFLSIYQKVKVLA